MAWDFDGNLDFTDASGASVQHIFADAGLVTVRMRLSQDAEETVVPHNFTVNARPTVSDARGARTTETWQITVQDPNGPTASFTFSPGVPLNGEIVTFTNTSTPSAGQSITGTVWDLDDDGEFDDSPAGWSFGIPGNHAVSVRVTQSNGKQASKQLSIRVNAPPTAAFTWSPLAPVGNQPVDLISTSTDAEGPLAAQDWELDGDDDFNDATGPSVTRAFPAGTHTVKLRVTDSDGVVRTVTRQVTVLDRPNAAFTVSPGVPLVGEVVTFANTSTLRRAS